jgi:hypothetical protein
MDQNGELPAWKNDIRCSGKIAPVQPEAKAETAKHLANSQFGGRIPRPDPGHHGASFRGNPFSLRQLGLAISRKSGYGLSIPARSLGVTQGASP